ncbi:hypothetical protein ETI11_06950 [Macrococcoides canis]|uniref:Uncharacterized protein n=1 Tax=Macrococcoides canis TaxID=1855823 RepID=A0A4R6C3S3_9STAP|nr:hypothetical protein [Macrococcus canis]TDM16168.1 hypothetical protein ETI04_09680 [Macrococcus canis]TDM37392.1 hypothetical protein ETI11_06950 [Macrococcus canis]
MQELNNMIEHSKMVMFSDVTTELKAVMELIKIKENIDIFHREALERDMNLNEIFFAIEDLCKLINLIAPKEENNNFIKATYNLERILTMINIELSNYISMNDLWEEE